MTSQEARDHIRSSFAMTGAAADSSPIRRVPRPSLPTLPAYSTPYVNPFISSSTSSTLQPMSRINFPFNLLPPPPPPPRTNSQCSESHPLQPVRQLCTSPRDSSASSSSLTSTKTLLVTAPDIGLPQRPVPSRVVAGMATMPLQHVYNHHQQQQLQQLQQQQRQQNLSAAYHLQQSNNRILYTNLINSGSILNKFAH